jgi:hypothetical protein
MLPSAYLTDRLLEIWRLRYKGLSKAEVGRILGITRQAVYEAEGIMLDKVERALMHTAEANMVEAQYVDASKGVLLGYSPATRNRVIVTFSPRNGVQTWHYQQPNCGQCKWVARCRERLAAEAEERGVQLSEEDLGLPPSELAHRIFSTLIPGL